MQIRAAVPGMLLAVFGIPACGEDVSLPPPANIAQLSELNDEFTDAASLADWQDRAAFERAGSDGAALIQGGQLLLRPNQNRYFLNDRRGLSLFKTIDATAFPNVMIETRVRATGLGTDTAPTEDYHSAGLVVYPNLNDMRDWVVVNIGRQDGFLGFEDKSTIDDVSNLRLYDTGTVFTGRLRICIVGSEVMAFTYLEAEGAWIERNSFTHTFGSSFGAGVMINDYLQGSDQVEGSFDYVRFREIDSLADCLGVLGDA